MKKRTLYSFIIAGALSLTACTEDRSPGSGRYDQNDPGNNYEFEGDMYYAVSFDPLSQWSNHYIQSNKDSINLRLPAKGTIARGKGGYIYPYANTPDEYFRAGKELKNPMEATQANLDEGKRLFELYCWHCHGKEGEGDGPIWASGVFPPASWKTYKSEYIRTLPEGQIFHTITYGKNLMGSHASQVTPIERWKLVSYVKFLSRQGGADADASAASATDSTAAKADAGKPKSGDNKVGVAPKPDDKSSGKK